MINMSEAEPKVSNIQSNNTRRYLFVMIGLPASGKSTFSKEFCNVNNIIRVSSDETRAQLHGSEDFFPEREKVVWEHLKSTLPEKLFQSDVLFDATNISTKNRKWLVDAADFCNANLVSIYMDTIIEECLKRNKKRGRFVPEDVIRAMSGKLRLPSFGEFPINIIVNGDLNNLAYRVSTVNVDYVGAAGYSDLYNFIRERC